VIFRFGNASEVETIDEKETINKDFGHNSCEEVESCAERGQRSNSAEVDDLVDLISACGEDGGVVDADSSVVKPVTDFTLETNVHIQEDCVEDDKNVIKSARSFSDDVNMRNPKNEVYTLSTSLSSDVVSDLGMVSTCKEVSDEKSVGEITNQLVSTSKSDSIEVSGSYASERSSTENADIGVAYPSKADKEPRVDTMKNYVTGEKSNDCNVTEVMHGSTPFEARPVLNEETRHSTVDDKEPRVDTMKNYVTGENSNDCNVTEVMHGSTPFEARPVLNEETRHSTVDDKEPRVDTMKNYVTGENSNDCDVTEVMHGSTPFEARPVLNEETRHSTADESVDADKIENSIAVSPDILLFMW
jgi:hypothetical protein